MQKRRWWMLTGVVVAVLSFGVLVAACGDNGDGDGDGNGDEPSATQPVDGESDDGEPADGEGATVDVRLEEFTVDPSAGTASAGAVLFNVSNHGAVPHNLRVIRTDLAPDALPVDDETFMVDEAQVEVVGSSKDLNAGESEAVSVGLEAGSYVLICNVATHYDAGMRVAFTVE